MAPANPELRELVKEMNRSKLAGTFQKNDEPLKAEGEICPSAVLPVLASNRAGERRVFPMKWGFSQKGGLIINARVETAAEKPMFRESWRKHRCVIPVSWYFEWEHNEEKKTGQKYALQPDVPGLVLLAGLYRMEEDKPTFVILTRPAQENLLWMHDRMPVMLPLQAAERWICPENDPGEAFRNCLTDIRWQKADA